mgnify:CR=1 FL=1
MRKILTLLLCVSFLVVGLLGCQDASKKPSAPERKPNTTVERKSDVDADMTPSERRVMASSLSKTAESVEGVQRASVVIASIGMTNTGVDDSQNGNMTDNNFSNSTNNKMSNNANNNNNMANNNNDKSIADRNDVSGLLVMVGITLEPTAKRDTATVNKVKNAVVNKIKASDADISQVLVTTDPNLIKRINNVAAAIIEGKPIEKFKDDINDLSGQIKRQTPAF